MDVVGVVAALMVISGGVVEVAAALVVTCSDYVCFVGFVEPIAAVVDVENFFLLLSAVVYSPSSDSDCLLSEAYVRAWLVWL